MALVLRYFNDIYFKSLFMSQSCPPYPRYQALTVLSKEGRAGDIFPFLSMAVRRTIKSNCFLPHCYTNNTNTLSSESLTQQERKQTLPMLLLVCSKLSLVFSLNLSFTVLHQSCEATFLKSMRSRNHLFRF